MASTLTVRDLPLSERPRERLSRLGAEVLDHLILGADGVVSLRAAGAIQDRRPRRAPPRSPQRSRWDEIVTEGG